jgi:hypothetical protein
MEMLHAFHIFACMLQFPSIRFLTLRAMCGIPQTEYNKSSVQLSRYDMQRQEGKDYSSYSFLTLALDGVSDEQHAPAAFYPRGEGPTVPIG